MKGMVRGRYQDFSEEQVYDYKRYRNLFEEEKKRGYGHKQYKNLPEDETQKLIEYRKIILKMH